MPPVAETAAFAPLATRIDPYVARPRVIVLTDIANEPDDQMSMVRFLVYSNGYDVEGLVATTSTWMRARSSGVGAMSRMRIRVLATAG